MRNFLVTENCWDVVENNPAADPAKPMSEKTEARALKSYALIALMIGNDQQVTIENLKYGYDAWKALKEAHQKDSSAAQVDIFQNLYSLKYQEGEDLNLHFTKLKEMVSDIESMGGKLENANLIAIIFASVYDAFPALITAMRAWSSTRLTKNEVIKHILDHWESQKSNSVALAVSKCGYCHLRGHTTNKCWKKKEKSKGAQRGFRSGYRGGYRGNNRNSQSRQTSGSNDSDEARGSANFAHEDDYDDDDDVSQYANIAARSEEKLNTISMKIRERKNNNVKTSELKNKNDSESVVVSAKMQRLGGYYSCGLISSKISHSLMSHSNSSNFYLDSGASHHMIKDDEFFISLDRSLTSHIKVANGDTLPADGQGTVKIFFGEEKQFESEFKATYAPKLDCNLISVNKLTQDGSKIIFDKNYCWICKNNRYHKIGEFKNGLYELKTNKSCLKVVSNSNGESFCVHEWHKRLAHRNLKDIKRMKSYGIDVRECDCVDTCESCIKGKMTRTSFPKRSAPTERVLDVIVSDVCGPMTIESLSRSRYFVTFIDVHSKYCEVAFMRQKSEVGLRLIEYLEKMKNYFGKFPLILRTDRATEYLCEKVQNYLKSHGIKFQCTAGYSPESNGVAERENRTLVESARTMLESSQLPEFLWAEAIKNANFTFNRMLNSLDGTKTPFEKFFNKSQKFKDFHEFGCDVYAHIPKEKRKKFDVKAEKLKFVGYDDESKAYRLYNANKRKIIISRDVKFLPKNSSRSTNSVVVPLNAENETMNLNDDLNEASLSSESRNDFEDSSNFEDATNNSFDPTWNSNVSSDIQLSPQSPRPIRATRNPNPTYVANKVCEPRTFKQASECDDKEKWKVAMDEEMESMSRNKVWSECDLPAGRTAIGCKWVYKIKRDENGKIVRHKARLVAQGFTQIYGVDYDEVFSPTARSTTLRCFLSFAGIQNYVVKHYDIKTAFLNGTLDEEIYMKQPPGYTENNNKVLRLKKCIYGLKQAARVWNKTLNEVLINIGFSQTETDKCLYVLNNGNHICYLLIHVDDCLFASNNENTIYHLAKLISKHFEMSSLGNVSHYLGMKIARDKHGNFLVDQEIYIEETAKILKLDEAKFSKYPLMSGYFKHHDDEYLDDNKQFRKIIGKLLYIATMTRPDIAAAVAILSQKISNPTKTDLNEAKRIVRYLNGTKDFQLHLSNKSLIGELKMFSDANWAENAIDRKSNSGYFCSWNGGAVSWSCRKQDLVTLSSTEAEYVALSEAAKELIWIDRLLRDFKNPRKGVLDMLTDSQSCMKMLEHQKFSNRTKHIDTKYHFIKDLWNKRMINLKYVSTTDNVADLMTKPLGAQRIKDLRELAYIFPKN